MDQVLNLTWRELDEFATCMTEEVYDKYYFLAKLHGSKMKRPESMRSKKKSTRPNNPKIDTFTESLFQRMSKSASKK